MFYNNINYKNVACRTTNYAILTQNTILPITPLQWRQHAPILAPNDTSQDIRITNYINKVITYFEDLTNYSLITTSVVAMYSLQKNIVSLEVTRNPVGSIASFKYYSDTWIFGSEPSTLPTTFFNSITGQTEPTYQLFYGNTKFRDTLIVINPNFQFPSLTNTTPHNIEITLNLTPLNIAGDLLAALLDHITYCWSWTGNEDVPDNLLKRQSFMTTYNKYRNNITNTNHRSGGLYIG